MALQASILNSNEIFGKGRLPPFFFNVSKHPAGFINLDAKQVGADPTDIARPGYSRLRNLCHMALDTLNLCLAMDTLLITVVGTGMTDGTIVLGSLCSSMGLVTIEALQSLVRPRFQFIDLLMVSDQPQIN